MYHKKAVKTGISRESEQFQLHSWCNADFEKQVDNPFLKTPENNGI